MQPWLHASQQQISQQIRNNKLPHALVLSGVQGAGYEELSLWLINVLLCQQCHVNSNQAEAHHRDQRHVLEPVLAPCGHCKTCKLFTGGNYPDHLTLSTDKATIGVDEVRNLSHFFEKTAHIGHAKTALVTQADRMTISAANALLKTLEEPTSNSFIILTTDRADTLLPTIISRCQQIEIRPPVGKALMAAFSSKNAQQHSHNVSHSTKKSEIFANLSHYNELSDEAAAHAFEAFRDNIEKYLCHRQNRTEVLKILVDDKNAMRWFERIIVDLMRKEWCWSLDDSNNQQTMPNKEQLWLIYCLVQKANMKLKTLVQVNRQFLSEKLLVDIINIINLAQE